MLEVLLEDFEVPESPELLEPEPEDDVLEEEEEEEAESFADEPDEELSLDPLLVEDPASEEVPVLRLSLR